MNVPSEQIIAGIVAITGFVAWIVRFFLKMFESHVVKQTETLTMLVSEGRIHDKLSGEAHASLCENMKEMTATLKTINGKGGKG